MLFRSPSPPLSLSICLSSSSVLPVSVRSRNVCSTSVAVRGETERQGGNCHCLKLDYSEHIGWLSVSGILIEWYLCTRRPEKHQHLDLTANLKSHTLRLPGDASIGRCGGFAPCLVLVLVHNTPLRHVTVVARYIQLTAWVALALPVFVPLTSVISCHGNVGVGLP